MANPINVLVVDDQVESFLGDINNNLSSFHFTGVDKFDSQEVLGKLNNEDMTVVLLDIIGEGGTPGLELFKTLENEKKWADRKGSVQIVFFSDEPTAIREYDVAKAKRLDVSGYLGKTDLFGAQKNALNVLREADRVARNYREYPSLADPILSSCGLVFSPNTYAMRNVREKILHAGRCWEPVLIQGETGTGKELVAKAIFEVMKAEDRKHNPIKGCDSMISYNIGSAPTEGNLQYTELFGAMRESYSGCTRDRVGIFERASGGKNGGTVFLDEIGDAHPIIQVSLLRVIQESEVVPLGGFNASGEFARKVRFRLIVASHVDLPERVRAGLFRADLYYRLCGIQITVPPLRERKNDIPVLVYLFLDKLNEEYKRKVNIKQDQESNLFGDLKAYDWPGNVRQLETAIRASYVMSLGDEFVLSDDIRKMLAGEGPAPPLSPEKILDGLAGSPRTLPKLAQEYGVPAAVAVGKLYVERNKRMPDEKDSSELFDSKASAVRKWFSQHGVKVRGKRTQ